MVTRLGGVLVWPGLRKGSKSSDISLKHYIKISKSLNLLKIAHHHITGGFTRPVWIRRGNGRGELNRLQRTVTVARDAWKACVRAGRVSRTAHFQWGTKRASRTNTLAIVAGLVTRLVRWTWRYFCPWMVTRRSIGSLYSRSGSLYFATEQRAASALTRYTAAFIICAIEPFAIRDVTGRLVVSTLSSPAIRIGFELKATLPQLLMWSEPQWLTLFLRK